MTISTCLMVNDFRNAYQLLKNFYKSVSTFSGQVVFKIRKLILKTSI